MKRRRLLSFAMALVMCISMCMPGLTAYAADPGNTPPAEPECSCDTRCTDGNINNTCTVCSTQWSACTATTADNQLSETSLENGPSESETCTITYVFKWQDASNPENQTDITLGAVSALLPAPVTVPKGEEYTLPVFAEDDDEYGMDVPGSAYNLAFVGWKSPEGTWIESIKPTGDVTLTGVWMYVKDIYYIEYEFSIVDEAGNNLYAFDDINALTEQYLPYTVEWKKDDPGYTEGGTAENKFDVLDDLGEIPYTLHLSSGEVTGTLSFDGWSVSNKRTPGWNTLPKLRYTLEGQWIFKPDTHRITYDFVSNTTGKSLPEEVLQLLPVPETVTDNTLFTGKSLKNNKVEVPNGYWKFDEWNHVGTNIKEDTIIQGGWSFYGNDSGSTATKYAVNYEFVNENSNEPLPQEIKNLLPKNILIDADANVPVDISAQSVQDTEDIYAVLDSSTQTLIYWKFKGWTTADGSSFTGGIPSGNMTLTGTWKKLEKMYAARYFCVVEYTVGEKDETEYLNDMEEDMLRFPDWGSSNLKYFESDPSYDTTNPGNVFGVTTDDFYILGDGSTYSSDSVIKVTGTPAVTITTSETAGVHSYDIRYTYEGQPIEGYTHNLSYQFINRDNPGETLPEAVTEQVGTVTLPEKTDSWGEIGDLPSSYKFGTVKTEEGQWKFDDWCVSNYSSGSANPNDASIILTGYWYFEPYEYDVTYSFISGTENIVLPQEILELLPDSVKDVPHGTAAPKPSLTQSSILRYEGTWTFRGWFTSTDPITQDTEIAGIWDFEVNPDAYYDVNYIFRSGTDGKDLPESVNTILPATGRVNYGQPTTAPTLETEWVDVDGGYWQFAGWSGGTTSAVGTATMVGTWIFVDYSGVIYDVTYSFQSGTSGKEIPAEVNNLLPDPGLVVHGDKTVEPVLAQRTVYVSGGYWTFTGWTGGTDSATGPVHMTGTWTFTSTTGGGSSSSSGGSSSSSGYIISVDKTTNGKVTVSQGRADKGDIVTITVKPDTGYELDELIVTDKNGDSVKLTWKDNNKYTFTMPGSKVEITATFAEISEEQVNPFTDVSEDAYYADAVLWAVANGVTYGTSATTFGPDMAVSRAQMVTFLWRAHGSPKATGTNPFTDVSTSDYYYDAVLWAVANGVTNGTSATTFSPDTAVTRSQAVTFQWRAAGSPVVSGSSFGDVATDAYYVNAVTWAVANGITNGTGGNTFSPDVVVSRAQAVTFLYREQE